jgi:VWFA-related protein
MGACFARPDQRRSFRICTISHLDRDFFVTEQFQAFARLRVVKAQFVNRLFDRIKAQVKAIIGPLTAGAIDDRSVTDDKFPRFLSALGRRRAMVVITDGADTESERVLNEVVDISQRSETPVYVISTESGGIFGVQAGLVDRKENKDLKRLAEETGGRAFFTADMNELKVRLAGIARELRSQYLIAYQPTNGDYDGKFRQVEVRLPNRKDLRIRTKKGYTAVPPRTASPRQ